MPSEVVNSVCSVLARLAFDLALWSEGKLRLLRAVRGSASLHAGRSAPRLRADPPRPVAHRQGRPQIWLLSRRRHPAARANSTRPSCRSARPSSPCGSPTSRTRRSSARPSPIPRPRRLAFLSSMGQREAIAFGEGVATTMRLKFERLDAEADPRHRQARRGRSSTADGDDIDLRPIVERLRNVPKAQQPAFAECQLAGAEHRPTRSAAGRRDRRLPQAEPDSPRADVRQPSGASTHRDGRLRSIAPRLVGMLRRTALATRDRVCGKVCPARSRQSLRMAIGSE